MKSIVLLIPLALSATICIRAQSIGPKTLNAAGGTGTIGTNEFDWSVGEMALVSTFSGSSIVVTQGVLQPSDAWPVDIGNVSLLKDLQVFPNPAASVVNIRYSSGAAATVTYRLVDMAGKVLLEHAAETKNGVLNEQAYISPLACAPYILEVSISRQDGVKENTSYKIQKIK